MQDKIGLSLSGGGFRASFYHIGVLARMAELGLLKKVEAISTVSGGSIVGVAYYILLKKMLERFEDKDISDQHYIDLVEILEEEFRKSVQQNLRWRTFGNPIANIKMALPSFSRSDQIGILYDKYIFNKLFDKNQKDKDGFFTKVKKLLSYWFLNPDNDITQLRVNPKGSPGFHPHTDNEFRTNKVPVLVVNATCLNSGHNWVFTTRSMGEVDPRDENFIDINKNDRYQKIKYENIENPRQKGFSLGKAVAASAGVPGAFPPMAISDLYEDHTIQLVDGGVFDNMGIAGLLSEPDVTHFIVSDASGQAESSDNPATGTLDVVLNTTNLLMGRVREEMVDALKNEHKHHVAYFHLNRGIENKYIAPRGQQSEAPSNAATDFGVEEEMQHTLSQVRTDLDSFSDKEIYTLELDGFLMTERDLRDLIGNLRNHAIPDLANDWAFQSVSLSKESADYKALLTHVRVAQYKIGKLFHFGFLKGIMASIVHLPVIALIAAFFYFPYRYFNIDINTLLDTSIRYPIYLALILLAFKGAEALAEHYIKGSGTWVKWIPRFFRLPQTLVLYILIPFLVSLPILLYLATADKYFLRQGRVTKRKDSPSEPSGETHSSEELVEADL